MFLISPQNKDFGAYTQIGDTIENSEQSKSMNNGAIRNGIYGYLEDYLLKIVSVTGGYEFSTHNRDLIE